MYSVQEDSSDVMKWKLFFFANPLTCHFLKYFISVEKNLGELSKPGTAKGTKRELVKQVVREVKKSHVKEADLERGKIKVV